MDISFLPSSSSSSSSYSSSSASFYNGPWALDYHHERKNPLGLDSRVVWLVNCEICSSSAQPALREAVVDSINPEQRPAHYYWLAFFKATVQSSVDEVRGEAQECFVSAQLAYRSGCIQSWVADHHAPAEAPVQCHSFFNLLAEWLEGFSVNIGEVGELALNSLERPSYPPSGDSCSISEASQDSMLGYAAAIARQTGSLERPKSVVERCLRVFFRLGSEHADFSVWDVQGWFNISREDNRKQQHFPLNLELDSHRHFDSMVES
ncbi:hypothetical protein BKA65DRAFT_473822 [Rhexocercosporidium sp. MPI-PUGE-AT-0058]|nr:hypothetical protein BKA65DRAFT_473822 [Rhexocercosporidium sp. MPI-PUGE-AT-0058]